MNEKNKKEDISIIIKKALLGDELSEVSFVVKIKEKVTETIFLEIKEYGWYSCLYFFKFEKPIKNRSQFFTYYSNFFRDTNSKKEFYKNVSLTENTFQTWMYRGVDLQSDIDALCLFLDAKYNSKNWRITKINEQSYGK